jgi:hypothetical protein
MGILILLLTPLITLQPNRVEAITLLSSTPSSQLPPSIAWVRNYTGQENADYASRVIQTNDGGYAVAGIIDALKYSTPEAWLIKIDQQGNIVWNQTFVMISENMTYKLTSVVGLVQTRDSGYVIAGTEAAYPSSDYSYPPGSNFAILFKTDSTGNIEWNQTYAQLSGVSYMAQTNDGGYALTSDYSLIKTNSLGKIQWQKSYENNVFKENAENEHILSVQHTSDGGYALLTSDNILFKVGSTGNLQWQQTYQTGTSYLGEPSYISSFIETSDSGYLFAGDLYTNNSTDHFATLIKANSNGKVEWNKTYGSLGSSVASLIQTSDGGFAFAGTVPGSGNYPQNLVWLVKTDSIGNLQWSQTNNNTSESLTDYFLGGAFTVNSLIETNDSGFMLAGTWNPGITFLDNAYYLVKAEPALPATSPSPTVPEFPFLAGLPFFIFTLSVAMILRHRKSSTKIPESLLEK